VQPCTVLVAFVAALLWALLECLGISSRQHAPPAAGQVAAASGVAVDRRRAQGSHITRAGSLLRCLDALGQQLRVITRCWVALGARIQRPVCWNPMERRMPIERTCAAAVSPSSRIPGLCVTVLLLAVSVSPTDSPQSN
jgi:hypothetical protein